MTKKELTDEEVFGTSDAEYFGFTEEKSQNPEELAGGFTAVKNPPKQQELTDEEVFGTQERELTDEEVFGGQPQELTDEEVFGDQMNPIDKFGDASKRAKEAQATFQSSLQQYEAFNSLPLDEKDEAERIRLFAEAENAQRKFDDEVVAMERIRPEYDAEIGLIKQAETDSLEKMRDNFVTAPLVDSFLEARDRRDAALAEIQGQDLDEETYNQEAQKIVDEYSKFITGSQEQAQAIKEEDLRYVRDLGNDYERVDFSGDRQVTTAEALGGVLVGTPEYRNLFDIAKDMGPEYVQSIIDRQSSLRDKARGVVSREMEGGVGRVAMAPYRAAEAVIGAVMTPSEAEEERQIEVDYLTEAAANGDQNAVNELNRIQEEERNSKLEQAIYELPIEERIKIRNDFLQKKTEERLAGLPPERKQAIIDTVERIKESKEAFQFDPESPKSYGNVLPDGSLFLTQKGKLDINAAVDQLVLDGQIPEERSDFYKETYNKREEDYAKAMRGASMETTSFKNWIQENPEYADNLNTDEGAKAALDAFNEDHNSFTANVIDIIPGLFRGINDYGTGVDVGASLSTVALSNLSDEEKADRMFDIYSEQANAMMDRPPSTTAGGTAEVFGNYFRQSVPLLALKAAEIWGGKTGKTLSKTLMNPTRVLGMTQMALTYGGQSYLDTVGQAVKESGYESIEQIQNENPELAMQINKRAMQSMVDGAKISVTEQFPIEGLVNTLGKRFAQPSKLKRVVEAFVTNPLEEYIQEEFSNIATQASQSRYSSEDKDLSLMGIKEAAQIYFGVLPMTGATAIGAYKADREAARAREILASLDVEAKARQEAADQAAQAAERAAGLAPESASALRFAAESTLEEDTNEMVAYMRDYESRAAKIATQSVPETRTIAESIQDKDTFEYQGMRGAITEEDGEVVFREFGTQSKYIVPVAPDQTLAEVEELQWRRKGQRRQAEGQPVEPIAVAERPAVVETNPIVTQEEFDSEPDDIEVPQALAEIEKSPILNRLADLFDTGDSRAVQVEKSEYKSGKRKGETYARQTETPVTELPEYYRQATPEQLNQAKRLVDSAIRLIDTMDVDEATKDQLSEHFLLLDQDITNYEQNPEYRKYKQERGWKVSTAGETGAFPTTATETEAAERELEQRVAAEIETRERQRSAQTQARRAAVVPPETPQGSRIKAAAYVAPDGTVYTADSHLNAMQEAAAAGKITQADVAKKQKATSRETPEFGFSTETDTFITRDQAENLARASGQLLTETPETGRLHSNEVALDDYTPDVDAPPYIAKAIVNRDPISVEDVDRAGVTLPKGYKADGDLYVYSEAAEKEVKPVRKLDAFSRIYAYVQDLAERKPETAETLKNKVGLIVKTLNARSVFSYPSQFQDVIIDGINNRLLSAVRRGVDPKEINAALIVKSAFSDASKTYPQEYKRVFESLQVERENGKKLDDILSGKTTEAAGKLTSDEKKTLEQTRRRTDAIKRKLTEKKMLQRIVSDFEETLNDDERLAFEFVKATERLNNDPSNKSKRRQADAARQALEDRVEDYEQLVSAVVQRFAELAERTSGQELTPRPPKVNQTTVGNQVASEQRNKTNVLAEVDAELAKTEGLTDAEQEARAKTEDPKINTVGAWVKTLPNTPLRRLVNLVIKASPSVANTPVQYVSVISGQYDGFYDPNNGGRIVLPINPTQDINLLVAHEMVHAATLEKSRLYDSGQFDQLTQDELNVFRELDKIRNAMIAQFAKGNKAFSDLMDIPDAAERALLAPQLVAEGKMGGELYALVNMGEFLANSINNPQFQKALDTIDPNILRQIWNLIKKLFYSNRTPSASVNAVWDSIVALSKTTKIGVEAAPAPAFKVAGIGIEGEAILENRSDLNEIIDAAVLDRKITADDAVKLKTVIGVMPDIAYRGAQVILASKLTRDQRRALDLNLYDYIASRGISDVVQGAPIIYINTSKAKGDITRTFIHENAHLFFDHVLTPTLTNEARDLYDSILVSRQDPFIAQYGWGGDTRFAEWFAESMADYYERKLEKAGISIASDTFFTKIYKKIVDLFSNERAMVDSLFDGLEASVFRAQSEVARQAEEKLSVPSVALRSSYSNAVKNGDFAQAKLVEEDGIQKIVGVLSPDLLKKDYREANKTNETYGHCYAASEALYHMLGGKNGGLVPMNGRDSNGVVHWWLRSKDGRFIDPTATQYTSIGLNPPYESGKGGGFLTKEPSRRAQTIIDRVNGTAFQAPAAAAIIPSSEGGNLSPVTRERLEELGVRSEETQIVTTESTYRRILDQIAKKGIKVIDWASGLGHGARLMKRIAKDMGFEAMAYEPFYNASKKGAVQEPDYNGLESVNSIPDNSFDYIINNAVLNVVDQDTRSTIVKQMYDKLKSGGSIYLQARGWTGDVSKLLNNPSNIVVGPREIFVTSKQTFQKGFTPQELIDFVESQLPDASVERTDFGGVGIKITKPQGVAFAAIQPKISEVSDEYDTSRVGTATQGKVKETTQDTNVSIETVDDAELAKQMADLLIIDGDMELPKSITSIKDPAKKRDAFINFVTENLVALYEAFPEELRAAATRWYDGARKIAQNMSKEFGITNEQAAGILAAFSPMKEWFQNIELGIQFARIFRDHRNTKISKAKYAQGIRAVIASASGTTEAARVRAREDRAKLLEKLNGRSIDGLWSEASRNEARAKKIKQSKGLTLKQYQQLPELKKAQDLRELASWAVRVIATQEYGLQYNVYSPDGDVLRVATNADGSTSTLVWQSASFIEKALSIAYDGSPKNISDNLAERHKIRSFYNNIIAPNSPYGDVTVDTHAVNAAVLFPMGNTGKMVGDAFGDAGVAGGGNKGTYWLFHEAYRRAAKKVGIQPRQMQSITWEAVRGLFPEDIKSSKSFVAEISNIWKNASNVESARKKIVSRGIRIPDWASAYTGGGGGSAESASRARATAGSKANIARGLRNRVRSGDLGLGFAAIDPSQTPDPDSQDNTSNEASEISKARADAKVVQESVIGHSILEDEVPAELRQELEASYKNGMTFEDFVNPETIHLDSTALSFARAIWLDLNGGLMPTLKVAGTQIDKPKEGTSEGETVRMLKRAFDIYNNISDSVENGKEVTYKVDEIVSTWLRSGLGEAALRNALVQFTNLNVPTALALSEDVVKQYEIQKRIADSKYRARVRMERALPAITNRQAYEKERMIRLEEAAGTIDSIAEAIKLAYDVNVNKARVDRATEKKQIEEQLRVAKQIIRDVVPKQYLGEQLAALSRATGLDGLKKIVSVAQDALNKARIEYALGQARKSFDRAVKSVRAGTLTPEAEAVLRQFVELYTKSGMSEKTKAEIQRVLDEYTKDPINALKNEANDKYLRRRGELGAIKIDASLGLDSLREITAFVNATIHMDKMAKGEMLFSKKLRRDEIKKSIIAEIEKVKTITKEEKGFGPKLGWIKWHTIFRGARVENILRGLGLNTMRKFIYEDLVLDAYNDELRNRITLKKKIESAIKQFTGLEIGSKDYDNYSKELFEVAGLDQSGNRTTIKVRRSELIDMVASLRDANNFKKAVRAGGYVIDRLRGAENGDTIEITPESYSQIQASMNQGDLDTINFIVGLYNNDLFNLLNDSSIQAYGHGIKKSDGVYYPRNAFRWDRVTETSENLDYMEYYNSRVDGVGHLKERVDETNARLVAIDFLSRLDYHVTNDSRIGAYLAISHDIKSVLRDADVMRPLERKTGANVVKQIEESVRQQMVPLPGLRDGIINTLVGNAGVGVLGFKIHAALQNPVGIPIAMAYYGTDGFKYSLQALANLRKGFNRNEYVAMEDVLNKYTPYYAERYGEGGFIQEFTSGLAGGPTETKWRKSIEDKSMSWLELTDKIGALARYKVAQQVVRDRTEFQEGTEEFDRAVAREWNLMMFRSENTSHGADRTGFFLGAAKNPMAKIFIMFQSAVSKQYSLFAEAVIQAQQGGRQNLQEAAMKMAMVAASIYMSLAISSAFYGILFPPDEEEEKELSDYLAALLSAPLAIFPVFGNTLQQAVRDFIKPEEARKPLQIDMVSSFLFGVWDASNLFAKAMRQGYAEEIDTKTGDPKWWNTSYKAMEKAFGLAGIVFRLPLGGILQSAKFTKRLAESTYDSVNGDLPKEEEFQKKLQKYKRETAQESVTQEYAKLYFAVAENDQNKFNKALSSLMAKRPDLDRRSVIEAIRRRPEFTLSSMVDRGQVKIGEHGITKEDYLTNRSLRSSIEKAAIDMWRRSKD
jgi:hypothetical protein